MTVRLKIALTIVATGLITALLVIATVLVAFERFENETTFQRATSFLSRVTATHDHLLDLHDRQPQEFNAWMRNLVLYEPDTQLYLLDAQGAILSRTGDAPLPAGYTVSRASLQAAVAGTSGAMPFVMGDDPERMDANAVIAARALRRAVIRGDEPVSGYLYLVGHKADLPASRWEAVRKSLALPALGAIAGIVALTTLLAWLVIASVTRPLRRLTDAVATLSQRGLEEGLAEGLPKTPQALLPAAPRDEFGQLAAAFEMMLTTLRKQWSALRRLDHFRREGVSNLSHDLRSPLTATVACLETLDGRWRGDAQRTEDRRLVEVALRNTRNAASLVKSLGDLAQLDEPAFQLNAARVDVGELLDDIGLRFAPRAAQQGVTLRCDAAAADGSDAPLAMLDVELFERAVANLIDNALKFCAPGGHIGLVALRVQGQVRVSVSDTGAGIAPADVPHLFDRFYQSRQNVAPATGQGGRGLGLAIVKRIVELHGGGVDITSALGEGTRITLSLPAAR
ncbi:MAG: hypothetical protein AD742_18915 [Methylibium sp. NZG]|nr:MAG: hypothetical protein AD742_18915 [Methylibium sp. NZG]